MPRKRSSPPPRFTKNQQQEWISRCQFQERVIRFGWVADGVPTDLGEDIEVRVYDDAVWSGISFMVQLKSVRTLAKATSKTGKRVFKRLDTKDLLHWEHAKPPVVLVLWGVAESEGHWLLVSDVVKHLDKVKKGWRRSGTVQTSFPIANRIDDDGLHAIRRAQAEYLYPAASRGKKLTLGLRFAFPDTVPAQDSRKSLHSAIATGTEAEISGEFIERFAPPEWFKRHFGLRGKAERIVIRSAPSKTPVRVKVEFIDTNHTELIPYLELRKVRGGLDEVVYRGEAEDCPVGITLTLTRKGGSHTLKLDERPIPRDVEGAIRQTIVGRMLAEGCSIRLSIHGKPGSPLEFRTPGGGTWSIATPEFERLLESLREIERRTGAKIELRENWRLFEREAEHIARVLEIVRTGTTRGLTDVTVSSAALRGDELARFLLTEKVSGQDTAILGPVEADGWTLMGTKIPLGKGARYVIAPIDAALAALMSAEGSSEITIPGCTVVEQYPDIAARVQQGQPPPESVATDPPADGDGSTEPVA